MDKIMFAHDSGGRLSHKLINEVFFKYFKNPILDKTDDSANIKSPGKLLAYTTDSFVIKPRFFPGGDIGKLAVCGTLNDIGVQGATPKYLTAGFIIEEGFSISELEKIVISMALCAEQNGVQIVAGDTKIVEKNACDGLFINVSGIGFFETDNIPDIDRISNGDKVIITGTIGDHGMTILTQRKEIGIESNLKSDCAALSKILVELVKKFNPDIKFMRDPTRGGLAGILIEIAEKSDKGIMLYEEQIPVSAEVKAICEILGFDPLYVANEGKCAVIVDKRAEKDCLNFLKKFTECRNSSVIGEIIESPDKKVLMKSLYGGTRIVSMLSGEQLPRIC
ncbi:hydrogenase expression/formation protein HypE [Candidatus Dependentiae bacterium]|nr:hydrogenase expression/formation protein HypE [Candidatus Dependentiae bacterium]